MITSSRLALSAAAALAAGLLLAGCASSPGDQSPTSGPAPDESGSSAAPISDDDIEAAWLDDGRMFAIVTWGVVDLCSGRRGGVRRRAAGRCDARGCAERRRRRAGVHL